MNRYLKMVLSVLLTISILLGGVGCMNQSENNKDIIQEKMYNYACEKYTQDFEIVDFEYALRGLDSDRRDVLNVKDNSGVAFRVFHYTDDDGFIELYDDYPGSIVDHLFADELSAMPEFFGMDYAVTISLDLGYESLYYEDVNHSSLYDILNKFDLYKITIVIICKDNSIKLAEKMDEFYNCYSKLLSFNSECIDFEVIKTTGNDEALEYSLSNIKIEYENDWSSFNSIEEFISVKELNVTFDEFKEQITEV